MSVPWRVRHLMRTDTYQERVAKAAWAFGVNGMLPPSYTRRPGRNVWRHAYIRRGHFTFAEGRIRMTHDDVFNRADWRIWTRADDAYDAARNANWGLTR